MTNRNKVTVSTLAVKYIENIDDVDIKDNENVDTEYIKDVNIENIKNINIENTDIFKNKFY